MRPECIQSVEAAIGRPLKAGEAADIEARIIKAKKDLAAQDRAEWSRMSENERLIAAGNRVGEQLLGDLAKKKQRLAQDIIAIQRTHSDIAANQSIDPLEMLNHMVAKKYDDKGNILSVDSLANARTDVALGRLEDLFSSVKDGMLGLFTNKVMADDLVREIHGMNTGNQVALQLAEKWRMIATEMKDTFNRLGGNIGHLDDWFVPHKHSALLMLKAGREAWTGYVLQKLNRNRYVNEDGTLMTDQQLTEFLNEAYLSITTDGSNKAIGAGQYSGGGSSKRADRGSESRQIHFKNGDAWIEYQAKFGEGDVVDIMIGHVRGMALDISLVERFGSNPEMAFKSLVRQYADQNRMSAAGSFNPKARLNALKVRTKEKLLQNLYDEVSAKNLSISNTWHNINAAYRANNVASRLGGTAIAALSDDATIARTMAVHGIAYHKFFGQRAKLLNPANMEDRQLARSLGLGMSEFLGAVGRFSDDGMDFSASKSAWAARVNSQLATSVMRVSGLNALTSANKQAFGIMMMDKYGTMTRDRSWQSLTEVDRKMLDISGIKEQDWQIWQKAQPLDRGDGTLILSAKDILAIPDAELQGFGGNPKAIKEQAAMRYHAHILDEQGIAVIEAGSREKAAMYGWMKNAGKGNAGEIVRNMLQFKSWVTAFMMRHGRRAMAQESVKGKLSYATALILMLTLGGMAILQLRELSAGNDPKDMSMGNKQFYLEALLAGGGLGIYGDILKSGLKPDGRGMLELLTGPFGGDVQNLSAITFGNAAQFYDEKNMNASAETVRFMKSHIPFSNLWYTKAATDHAIFNQAIEAGNPGYLKRKEARDRAKFDRTSWWSPDDMLPERAPDWEKAVGE